MRGYRTYRIIIAGPSALILRGLEAVLSESGDFQVVASVTDVSRCQEKVTMLSPDAVIMDPSMADHSRRTTLRNSYLGGSTMAFVGFLSSLCQDEVLKQFDESISVFDEPGHLLRKLRSVLKETDRDTAAQAETYELSDREKEILVSVARGLTNKEIADHHNISIHTVISHRKNITRKTGIKTVSGLTVYALLNSLMDMSDVEQ